MIKFEITFITGTEKVPVRNLGIDTKSSPEVMGQRVIIGKHDHNNRDISDTVSDIVSVRCVEHVAV